MQDKRNVPKSLKMPVRLLSLGGHLVPTRADAREVEGGDEFRRPHNFNQREPHPPKP